MERLHFNDLPQGGFNGLREKQFVTDRRVFGGHKHPAAANGLGNFVYLADANFFPHGETGLHPHREVDVISVMVRGRIAHEGSLENGQSIEAGSVQVQRAGGEGFSHNEVNPDDKENQMIQMWVLPEQAGLPAGYRVYSPAPGERMRIYGGPADQDETFDSRTLIDVINAKAGQSVTQKGEAMIYLAKGTGELNGEALPERTLVRGRDFDFTASDDSQLIVISEAA